MERDSDEPVKLSYDDFRERVRAFCDYAITQYGVPPAGPEAIRRLMDLSDEELTATILFLARLGIEIDHGLNATWAASQVRH